MICKKSVEDVVRTKSLTSFVNLENRAKDDDDSSRAASAVQAAGQEQKRFERKFRFHETSKLLPHIQRGKSRRAAFSFTFCSCAFVLFFSYRWVCHSGVRGFVIATITAAARDEKKNGSFATTIAASSQEREREREKSSKASVGR
jgi:hypothetical protein